MVFRAMVRGDDMADNGFKFDDLIDFIELFCLEANDGGSTILP